eukprot:Phypoly_transcript_20613.p2 GENE.Phypoly_transcript_20613~~Phypoly_transcript_20613.p2  ORF type:complete len:180 (+),score=28.60 Phypoly_transcript_20613:122-661(+)
MAVERGTDFFKLFDGNKNGTIEAKDAAAATKVFAGGGAFPAPVLAVMENSVSIWINGIIQSGAHTNGKVTKQQWIETAQNTLVGKPFESAPDWFNKSIGQLFKSADRNNNGKLGETEFVELFTGMVPTISVSLAQSVFKQVQGDLDKPAFRKQIWTWISSPMAMPQDLMLSMAVAKYNA